MFEKKKENSSLEHEFPWQNTMTWSRWSITALTRRTDICQRRGSQLCWSRQKQFLTKCFVSSCGAFSCMFLCVHTSIIFCELSNMYSSFLACAGLENSSNWGLVFILAFIFLKHVCKKKNLLNNKHVFVAYRPAHPAKSCSTQEPVTWGAKLWAKANHPFPVWNVIAVLHRRLS